MEEIKTKRQSNFELLRIFAMVMIVSHHLAVHGVVPEAFYESSSFLNKSFAAFLIPGGTIGVALFFMLSGFFLCGKEKGSVKKVALEAAFYSFLIAIVFAFGLGLSRILTGGYGCTVFSEYSLKRILGFFVRSVFRPVTSGWWFTTAYIILILICPVINDFIKRLTRNGFLCFLLVVWAFYYTVGFTTGDGYLSVTRAVLFYLLGAFIKMHCPQKISKISFSIYAVLCAALWLLMSFLFYNSYYIRELPDLFSKKT